MTISRRSLLTSSALLGAAALAGCTMDQITAAVTSWQSVETTIQNAVAAATAGANAYIPTLESIASVAANIFGPQYATIVTVGSTLINQIISALTAVVGVAPPPASSRHLMAMAHKPMQARLRTLMATTAPVFIGTTSNGVQVTGWKA
jgi:hypothetical protein